ncbi:hypothetical protein T07_10399 [Trichinella nelsoni]|uniref:Uncharacterized protein n=1 Tax=Trichinella nelsoni TaxID=6336 RepID=A0A0V0RCD6_9BILA|nr:hypothetical protein T07_10399 [Trichinella nelsoni]
MFSQFSCQMRELNTRRSSVSIMAALFKMAHPSASFARAWASSSPGPTRLYTYFHQLSEIHAVQWGSGRPLSLNRAAPLRLLALMGPLVPPVRSHWILRTDSKRLS